MRNLTVIDAFCKYVEACRAKHLVDYAEVAAMKLSVLEKLFDATDPARRRAFEGFRGERGEVLERSCLFLTLREHFARENPSHADWHVWPEESRDPTSPA